MLECYQIYGFYNRRIHRALLCSYYYSSILQCRMIALFTDTTTGGPRPGLARGPGPPAGLAE
jgi:hypothetical protein